MKQITKYIGLLAIFSLGMVALAPELIGDVYGQEAEGSPGQQSPNPMDQQLMTLFAELVFAAHLKAK